MQNRDKNTSLYFLCPSATAGCNYVTGPIKRKWRGNYFALPEAGSYPRVGSELWQCNLWIRNPCHLSKPHWEADSKCSQTTKTWCSHLANSVRCRDMGATDANRSGLGILPCPLICGVGHSCSPCWEPGSLAAMAGRSCESSMWSNICQGGDRRQNWHWKKERQEHLSLYTQLICVVFVM